jgi:ribosomal protein S14
MRYSLVKYRRMRYFFCKGEFYRNLDLFFVRQENFDVLFSFFSRCKLSKLSVSSSLSRVKNFCFVTGRVRGFIRFFGVSRIVFRTLVGEGVLVGIRRAIW